MIDGKYRCIPENLLDDGHNLECIGVMEIAWEGQKALQVIEFLSSKGFPILGGDVYSFNGANIEPTYDSWYSNKGLNSSFVQESRKKAIEYIMQYAKNNGDNFIYSIVFELIDLDTKGEDVLFQK